MWAIILFLIKAEIKSKYTLMGVFLYIFIAVLISYLSMPLLDKNHYLSVYWLIILFTTLQGISKNYIGIPSGEFLFWHQLTNAQQFLTAKLISNSLLMFLFSVVGYIMFMVIHHGNFMFSFPFLLTVVLTTLGISSIFTIGSSIAAKTNNAHVLIPILTFPLVLPFLLIGIKACQKLLIDSNFSVISLDILLIVLLLLIVNLMGVALVKFVWKE